MVPVVPVLVPQAVGVQATADQAGDDGTVGNAVSYLLCTSLHNASSPLLCREKHLQDGQLVPQVCRAIELVQSTCEYSSLFNRGFCRSRVQLGSRTAGGSGVVLDGSTLTVELVVDDPRGLGLGGVETALGDRASLLRSTLGEAGDVALSEHGGWLWECRWLAERGEKLKHVVR